MERVQPIEQQLAEGLRALGLDLPPGAQQQLLAYTALLCKWNKTYNLTALRSEQQMLSHHLLDSLSILPQLIKQADQLCEQPAQNGHLFHLLDVGSGGGFPGIPLAIARPDWMFTLLDSNSKKTAFLQQASIELGLGNVVVHCGRVEQYPKSVLFSAIVARAFSSLFEFVSLSQTLLQADGRWLAMKGAWPQEELDALAQQAIATVDVVHRLVVPGLDAERHLVVLRHGRATP
ncbi:MAG: 16S rRNA (guanine(527)-N(7))-methyltransferase RsmG [Pseudomonadota bacterium]